MDKRTVEQRVDLPPAELTAEEQQDQSLARGAQRGEKSAFAELYARHHRAVFGYFRARVLDPNDAEDLCQEVFFRAFGAIERYDTAAKIRPWLVGISRNVLREHVRRVHRRKETGWTELCMELEQMAGDAESPYEEVLHLLPLCLQGLGDSASKALHWHYMGGQKIQEIADRLDRTVGAVKVLMVRARQALKRCIHQHIKQHGGTGIDVTGQDQDNPKDA